MEIMKIILKGIFTVFNLFFHMQVHSFIEYFEGDCTDPIHWMSAANYFPGFTEGWTTYVEYELLPQDTLLYSNTLDKAVLLQKYGMIYYQVTTSPFKKKKVIFDKAFFMRNARVQPPSHVLSLREMRVITKGVS